MVKQVNILENQESSLSQLLSLSLKKRTKKTTYCLTTIQPAVQLLLGIVHFTTGV